MSKILLIVIIPLLYCQIYGQKNNGRSMMTLNNAIEIALKNNPQIKISSEKIDAMEGKFWNSISLPPPTVSLSYEYTPLGKNLRYFGEKTLEINQSFNFPSYYFLRGSGFSIEKEISEHELRIIKFNVINQVKIAYFNALAKLELLGITEENLNILQDFSRKVEIKYKTGEGTNLERLTAKVQLSEAKNSLENAKNQLKTTFNELNFSIGFSEEDYIKDFVFTDSLKYHEIKINLEEATELAALNNLQISISKLVVKKSSMDKTLAWSNILPGFNISYFKQTRDGNSDFYGALFGISIPIWFFLDQRGQIQEASAKYHTAEAELQSNMNLINLKVRNSFLEFKDTERELLLYRTDILPQSYEVYLAAEKSYDAGESTYLEYLQAKQILISTRSNHTNALLRYNIALSKLEESIGKNLIDD